MNDLRILKTQYKVSDFISWQRAGTLTLSPSFQRRPVWTAEAKSYLIDTIVRGLPMPIIFLRNKTTDPNTFEPNREVVDGQQRIRTVISYIDRSSLNNLTDRDNFTVKSVHNSELAGKEFRTIPRELQQRILDYEFSVHVLPSIVDDRDILQLFARMNSTGVKLNQQELINAEFFGEFKSSMYEIASEQLNRWRDWKIFTEENIARMDEVSLTSEFALLMSKGISAKTASSIKKIYKDNDEHFKEKEEVEFRFRHIMDTIDEHLGNELRFTPFRKKTLFYCLFAFIYDVSFGLESELNDIEPKALSIKIVSKLKEVADKMESEELPPMVKTAASRRTTHLVSRETIVNYLRRVCRDA